MCYIYYTAPVQDANTQALKIYILNTRVEEVLQTQ